MRPQFEPIQIRPPEPPGNSGKVLLLLMVTLGILSVGGYLVFVPEVTDRLPFELNAATASIAQHGERLSDLEPKTADASTASLQQPAPSPGLSEIPEKTSPGDTLQSILTSWISNKDESQESAKQAAHVLAKTIKTWKDSPVKSSLDPLQPGKNYTVIIDKKGGLSGATIEFDPGHVFHVVMEDGQPRAWQEDAVVEFKVESLEFKITSTANSVSQALMVAGEGGLDRELVSIFKHDIDFNYDCRVGDTCRILFERKYADDRPSGYGKVLAAVYKGKRTGRKTAFLFGDTYYNETGVELEKEFLRSPLKSLRVTSRYGKRFHPILKKWRRHNGVDYGAPTGTPVYTIATGKVVFAGWAKGYGKYVRIRHRIGGNVIESRYGHLSRFKVRKGQYVRKGAQIGKVGSTGLSTGPHLDFQLLVNGKHTDPEDHKMIPASALKKVPHPLRPRFQQVVQQRGSAMGLTRLGQDLDDRVRTARLR